MKPLPEFRMPRTDFVRHQHFHSLADKLFPRVAKKFFALSVGQLNGSLGVHHHQSIWSKFHHAAEELLRLTQAFVGLLALGDVRIADARAHYSTVLEDLRNAILHRETAAVLAPQKFVVNMARLAVRIGGEHWAFFPRVQAAVWP